MDHKNSEYEHFSRSVCFCRAPVISAATGWTLSVDNLTVAGVSAGRFEADISSLVKNESFSPTIVYWKAPYQFLGDQVSPKCL